MSDYFPQEVLVEILQRLPIKSLVKSTCVCKAWKSLITQNAFISDHLSHNHHNPSLFLQFSFQKGERVKDRYYEEVYSLYSGNGKMGHLSLLEFPRLRLFPCKKILVSTCNGLVCQALYYSDLNVPDVIIWNPSIRKYVVLPKSTLGFGINGSDRHKHGVSFGFGFDSRNMDFKVVKLLNKNYTPEVEVYSLATRSWRSISDRVPPILLCFPANWTSQAFVNGALHWVVSKLCDGQIYKFILSFDVAQETFKELMLPQPLKESFFEVSILAGGGDLLAVLQKMCYSDRKSFSVWVMKEYGVVNSWTEVFHSDSRLYGGIKSVLALRTSGEVVLQLECGAIVLVDPITKLGKNIGVTEVKDLSETSVGYHEESLFLINKGHGVLSY